MAKIRALIVDDAVVIRKLVGQILTSDPDIEVVGVAANGKIAVAKIPQVNPDLVIMDVEMPEMDGLTALKEMRKLYAKLPVIIFSTLTERGAETTLEALALGATDYVTKPSNVGSLDLSIARVKSDLIPKIKAIFGYAMTPTMDKQPMAEKRPEPPPRPVVRPLPPAGSIIEVVAIGVSTGGPNALTEVIPQLPADFPVPIVIVQHMPPIFTRFLAERLASKSKLAVAEARTGDILSSGKVLIAPGDFHLAFVKNGAEIRAATHQAPPENSCRPAVDVLFRSVAELYGHNALAVVLTGMGQDGLRGCEQIRQVGGQIIVQDEATSVVWGMPGFVAKAGLADGILPLGQIAQEIIRRVLKSRSAGAEHLAAGETHGR